MSEDLTDLRDVTEALNRLCELVEEQTVVLKIMTDHLSDINKQTDRIHETQR